MKQLLLAAVVATGYLFAPPLGAQDVVTSGAATLVSADNRVEIAGANGAWAPASAGQALSLGDRLKTGEDSRASVRMADGSVLQLDELTTIEIKPPQGGGGKPTLSVPSGATYFFSRGQSREVRVETPSANGAIRGTAFLLKVNPYDGRTSVSMMEGEFELSNMSGVLAAVKGEQAEIARGASPIRSPLDDRGRSGPWYLVIENRLETLRPLSGADRSDFFRALPAVAKQWRFVSPQLAGAATIQRREWSEAILESAFGAVGPDCPLLKRILRSCIDANPAEAQQLIELAMRLFPKCAEEFQDAGQGDDGDDGGGGGPPPNANSSFAEAGGFNGAGGQGNAIAICHNGTTIFVSPADAENHLQNHAGDTLGQCQVTPFQNQ